MLFLLCILSYLFSEVNSAVRKLSRNFAPLKLVKGWASNKGSNSFQTGSSTKYVQNNSQNQISTTHIPQENAKVRKKTRVA